MQHLEEKNTCPDCNLVIHQSHPLQYISHDRYLVTATQRSSEIFISPLSSPNLRTMQDIVYKLVPNLQESEYSQQYHRLPSPA